MYRRAYTVDEANRLIPELEQTLVEIERRMGEVRRAAVGLQVLDVLWGPRLLAADNPDYGEARTFRLRISDLMSEVEGLIQQDIIGRGLRFPQGGLENGLVDFPTTWQGRWVLLCWQRGEAGIAAWHEIDGGFAGRRPLTREQARRMGHPAS